MVLFTRKIISIPVYIWCDTAFNPLHGLLRMCLGFLMFSASTHKMCPKSDKPCRHRMPLRGMWLRHSLVTVFISTILKILKFQPAKHILVMNRFIKKNLTCTVSILCGSILHESPMSITTREHSDFCMTIVEGTLLNLIMSL